MRTGTHDSRQKYVLLPFMSKSTLKVLHIRQSAADIQLRGSSWAILECPVQESSDARAQPLSDTGDSDAVGDPGVSGMTDSGMASPILGPGDVSFRGRENLVCREILQNEFCNFADWILKRGGYRRYNSLPFVTSRTAASIN